MTRPKTKEAWVPQLPPNGILLADLEHYLETLNERKINYFVEFFFILLAIAGHVTLTKAVFLSKLCFIANWGTGLLARKHMGSSLHLKCEEICEKDLKLIWHCNTQVESLISHPWIFLIYFFRHYNSDIWKEDFRILSRINFSGL